MLRTPIARNSTPHATAIIDMSAASDMSRRVSPVSCSRMPGDVATNGEPRAIIAWSGRNTGSRNSHAASYLRPRKISSTGTSMVMMRNGSPLVGPAVTAPMPNAVAQNEKTHTTHIAREPRTAPESTVLYSIMVVSRPME